MTVTAPSYSSGSAPGRVTTNSGTPGAMRRASRSWSSGIRVTAVSAGPSRTVATSGMAAILLPWPWTVSITPSARSSSKARTMVPRETP